jgi:hypothetical protein
MHVEGNFNGRVAVEIHLSLKKIIVLTCILTCILTPIAFYALHALDWRDVQPLGPGIDARGISLRQGAPFYGAGPLGVQSLMGQVLIDMTRWTCHCIIDFTRLLTSTLLLPTTLVQDITPLPDRARKEVDGVLDNAQALFDVVLDRVEHFYHSFFQGVWENIVAVSSFRKIKTPIALSTSTPSSILANLTNTTAHHPEL